MTLVAWRIPVVPNTCSVTHFPKPTFLAYLAYPSPNSPCNGIHSNAKRSGSGGLTKRGDRLCGARGVTLDGIGIG